MLENHAISLQKIQDSKNISGKCWLMQNKKQITPPYRQNEFPEFIGFNVGWLESFAGVCAMTCISALALTAPPIAFREAAVEV